jgi:hypothetical protein
MKLLIIIILAITLATTLSAREDIHEPCGCDTCCEAHYEAIREANPQFNLPAIE